MAKFNNNFTDELRARLSIVDIVGQRVPLAKKGQNFWGCCPFHNEKTPSFSVNEEKGFYHCFGCGEHGDLISFVMKTNNVDFKTAIANLAQQAGIKLPDYKQKTAQQIAIEESYFGFYEQAAKLYEAQLWQPVGAEALEYLRRRGFDDEKIRKYRLGYAPKGNLVASRFFNNPPSATPPTKGGETRLLETGLVRHGNYGPYDFFRDRLMFPIFNPNGQIIAFSGRSLDGCEPKYINVAETEFFRKRQTLFGLNFARNAIYRANRSIIVEGQIDAIQMQTHGFPETVAPLGTAITEEHLQILCKLNRNIFFCFDGDLAGQKAAARAAGIVMRQLRDNSDVRFAFSPKGSDPDDVLRKSQDEMKRIIDSAMPIADFVWKITNEKFIIATPGGRTQAEKFFLGECEKIQDDMLKKAWKSYFYDKRRTEWNFSGKIAAAVVPEVKSFGGENKLSALIEERKKLVQSMLTDSRGTLETLAKIDKDVEKIKKQLVD